MRKKLFELPCISNNNDKPIIIIHKYLLIGEKSLVKQINVIENYKTII